MRGLVHINGAEPFWALVGSSITGIHRALSPKHLWRYLIEFAVRQELRKKDTAIIMMESVARGMISQRLTYAALTAG